MSEPTVRIFQDVGGMSHFAAELFKQTVLEADSARKRFLCALSGGGTPLALYHLLAKEPYNQVLPWQRMFFFWGDERCVPPDNAESNYYQARQNWLGKVPVPDENIHRVMGELEPFAAARDYARQLKLFAEPGADWPRFDLVLLGLGQDGHTASLFPGSPVQELEPTVAVTAQYQDRPANRVSLTPHVINSARNVVFLVSGPDKAPALSAVLAGDRDPQRIPAQRILPEDGKLWWLVDLTAASQLPESIKGIRIQH
jgi:6-phosphogluconolactonase